MTQTEVNAMQEAINRYLEAIKEDYANYDKRSILNDQVSFEVRKKMIEEFNAGLEVVVGKKYLKVVTKSGSSRSVHSFIVVEDEGKFKKGDILKAASWAAPAKNSARGNILGQYRISWTGAEYLR